MHKYSDEVVGCYIKKNYSDFDKMSCSELKQLYMLSEIYKNLLEGDEKFHTIEEIEEKTK